MKKTLLTASLLLASMTSVFAQMPDASQWKVGDDITDKVGWGNLSFENDPMDYWHLERFEEKGSLTVEMLLEKFTHSYRESSFTDRMILG